jgi:hypothetical protein
MRVSDVSELRFCLKTVPTKTVAASHVRVINQSQACHSQFVRATIAPRNAEFLVKSDKPPPFSRQQFLL